VRAYKKVENDETWGEEGEYGEEDAFTTTMKKCCQNIIILSPTLRLHFNLWISLLSSHAYPVIPCPYRN